jgi:hypothetical protein
MLTNHCASKACNFIIIWVNIRELVTTFLYLRPKTILVRTVTVMGVSLSFIQTKFCCSILYAKNGFAMMMMIIIIIIIRAVIAQWYSAGQLAGRSGF